MIRHLLNRPLIRRLSWAVVTLWGVTLLAFLVLYRIPADPAVALAGPSAAGDPAVVQSIRARLRLDQPVWVQYGDFLLRLSRGDLGQSYVKGTPVREAITAVLPNTLLLGLSGWACWLVLGTGIGVLVAARPGKVSEGLLLAFSILGASTPAFWIGILLLYVFVARLGWFPAGGTGTPKHLVLPLITLAASGVAYYARLAHSAMSDTLREDFIRTAKAKGLSPTVIVMRHALRNALLPLVTIAGADLAALLGGVVFTESVFAWNGLGQLAVEAVAGLDIPVIMGVVLVSGVLVVAANLVVDLIYPIIDPRIRSGT